MDRRLCVCSDCMAKMAARRLAREVPGPHVLSLGHACDVHPTPVGVQATRVVEATAGELAAWRRASVPWWRRALAWLGIRLGPRVVVSGVEGNAWLTNGESR